MERLDKVIAMQTEYSRKDVKILVSKRKVFVNGNVVLKSDIKVDEQEDEIIVDGKKINFKMHVYLVLNKPKGYISATEDRTQKTVLDLVPNEYGHREVFPVGRLDKDTTGLMILSDDGEFAHNILAPKKHIEKEYEVTIDIPVTEEMKNAFLEGINLNDGVCKTAKLEITGEYTSNVTLTEGRYHQIKRMFGCFGATVVELNRIRMGKFTLPKDLEMGKCRELTDDELNKILER